MSASCAIARNTTVRCKHPSVMAHRRRASSSRIARRASSSSSSSSSSETSSSSEETPEQILRVSKRTSFEGLKASRRVELEKAVANGDDARVKKIEWAYDALIAESKAFFDERVAKDENAETRFQLGNFYQTLEKFEDAEREYRRSIELGTNVDACNNLAMILQERGELDEAEAFYLKALEPDENNVDVLFNWATLKLNGRQDLNSTRILIEKIVTIQPELKKHPLVKALRDDDDDDDDEPFVPPI